MSTELLLKSERGVCPKVVFVPKSTTRREEVLFAVCVHDCIVSRCVATTCDDEGLPWRKRSIRSIW
jgi:hypothetical protein